MNKLAIAVCLLGFIALASTAPAPEQCLQLLADELLKTNLSERVPAYVDYLDSVLPVDSENEWDVTEFKKIESEVEYPWEDCAFYLFELSNTVDEVLSQRNDCAEVINKALGEPKHDDDQALKELRKDVRAHKILGFELYAKTSCTKFQPYRDLDLTLPACLQKTVDRAQTVDVPKAVKRFVFDSRKMNGIINDETIRSFRSDALVKECTIFLETMKDINLQFNKEDCLDEFEDIMNNWNMALAYNRVAMDDEHYAFTQYAVFGCMELITPASGMEEES